MQRRTTLHTALAVIAATTLAWGAGAQAQQPGAAPKIAVTDLAYAQRVSEYFVAGTYQRSSQMSAQGSQGGEQTVKSVAPTSAAVDLRLEMNVEPR